MNIPYTTIYKQYYTPLVTISESLRHSTIQIRRLLNLVLLNSRSMLLLVDHCLQRSSNTPNMVNLVVFEFI